MTTTSLVRICFKHIYAGWQLAKDGGNVSGGRTKQTISTHDQNAERGQVVECSLSESSLTTVREEVGTWSWHSNVSAKSELTLGMKYEV